jgi:hypothetical protein
MSHRRLIDIDETLAMVERSLDMLQLRRMIKEDPYQFDPTVTQALMVAWNQLRKYREAVCAEVDCA